MKEKLKKYDKTVIGVVVGLVLTVLGFLLANIVLTRGNPFPISEFLRMLVDSQYSQNIMIFCLLPNMFLFYLVNFRWNLGEFTKGLVAVTLLLAVTLVVLSF